MLERMKEASAKRFSTKRLRRHSRVEFLIQTFEVFLGLAYVADALPFRLTKCIVNHRLEEAHVIGKLLQVSLRLLSCGSFLPQSLTGPHGRSVVSEAERNAYAYLEERLKFFSQIFDFVRVHIGQDSLGVLCKEARCEHGEGGYIRLQPYSRLIIEEAARALR